MRTTIDGAGRVVIPKAIRDALGLSAGTEIDIEIDGVAVRLEGARQQRGVHYVDGLAVLDPVPGEEPMTVDSVRKLRLDLQR